MALSTGWENVWKRPQPLCWVQESLTAEPPPCLACLWVGEPGAWRGAQGPGEVTQSRVASSVAPVGPTHPSDMASPARWSKRVEAKVLAPCLPLSLGPVWAASVPFLGAHAAKLFQPRLPARGARLDGAYTAWVGGFPLPPQECRAEVGPGLRALPRSKPLRFRFSGAPQRHRFRQACVLCPSQPWEAQSSPRVARESWGLRSSHCRAEETSPKRVSEPFLRPLPP